MSSVPILLRLIAACESTSVACPRPIRIPRSRIVKRPDALRSAVDLAVGMQGGGPGGVLMLIDADTDPPCSLGPELQSRVSAHRPDRRVRVALAVAEYEAWFLAAARSLAGARGLPADLIPPAEPESIRDAKGWLSQRMKPVEPSGYSPTIHQPSFTSRFSLDEALNTRSFRKLYKEARRLLTRPGG